MWPKGFSFNTTRSETKTICFNALLFQRLRCNFSWIFGSDCLKMKMFEARTSPGLEKHKRICKKATFFSGLSETRRLSESNLLLGACKACEGFPAEAKTVQQFSAYLLRTAG